MTIWNKKLTRSRVMLTLTFVRVNLRSASEVVIPRRAADPDLRQGDV